MIRSANANSIKLGSLLHDNCPVYSQIYQHEAVGCDFMGAVTNTARNFWFAIINMQ